jgi:hypothetical protein
MRKDEDPLVREIVEERISAAQDENESEHAVIEMNRTKWEGRKH